MVARLRMSGSWGAADAAGALTPLVLVDPLRSSAPRKGSTPYRPRTVWDIGQFGAVSLVYDLRNSGFSSLLVALFHMIDKSTQLRHHLSIGIEQKDAGCCRREGC